MKEKYWYKKKRYWILVVLSMWLIFSRLPVTNFCYDPDLLEAEIIAITDQVAEYKTIFFYGSKTAYIKVGNSGTAPLVVFVHGSPGSLTSAKKYLIDDRLLSKADVISIDRLGFGYSNYGRAEPSLQRHADMLHEVLKPYLNRKVILVGHSMGGPIISKYAMDYQNQLAAMVLIAPSISPSLEPSNMWRQIIDVAPIRWLTPPAFRVCNQEIIPLKKELSQIENQWYKIKVPVTIIHGTEDKLVPFGNADYAKTVLINSPIIRIREIEGGNHFIFWNEHDRIVEGILELLRDLN